MKKLFSVIAIFSMIVTVDAFAGSGQKSFPLAKGVSSTSYTSTYANSQIDTLILVREGEVAAYGLGIQWGDSVGLFATAAIVTKYVVNGTLCSVPSTVDSLSGSGNFIGTTDGSTTGGAGGLANGSAVKFAIGSANAYFWDRMLIIVKYAAAGNGTTTPNVRYTVYKTYSTK